MKLNVLIVEDEVLISELLREIVKSNGYRVTDVCADEVTASTSINTNPPDMALLDIRLLGNDSGMNVARALNSKNIPFAFITSFADKRTIQEAVALGPKGYILKPFEPEEVMDVLKHLKSSKKQTITIKDRGDCHLVNIDDIKYVQSDNVYLEIFTTLKKYVVRQKISDFVSFLPSQQFVRVHRSFAVNIDYVMSYNKQEVLIEGKGIPISKKYSEYIFNILPIPK